MRPLTLLLIASLLLPSATAALVAAHSYRQTMESARSGVVETATVLREHALRTLEAQGMAIAWIDNQLETMGWDEIQASADIHALLRQVAGASPHIDGLWLVRPDGKSVNSADFFPMEGTDVTEREYYQVLRDRDVLYLGEMVRGYLKGTLNFNLSRRRSADDGTFNGLILVTSSLAYFENFWEQALPGQNHVVALVREDGRVLARWPRIEGIPARIPASSPFYSQAVQAPVGAYEFTSLADGNDRFYGYAKLGFFPAHMIVGVDVRAVLAPWRQQAIAFFMAAIATSLVLATVVLLAQRREDQLSREVARRQRVETSLIAKEEHLAALSEAEGALRTSEQRFRTLFDSLIQGVMFIDQAGRITQVNPAAERIAGLPAASIIGHSLDDLGLAPLDDQGTPLPVERRPSSVALRTGMILNGILVGFDRREGDRERRWLMLDAIPLRQPGEEAPSAVCILFNDITEKRRAEEAQRILMREVDHRAKNALAVAQALVRLTRADSHEDFIKALEGRIAALARAHTLLARSHWRGALLAGLLEEELEPYRAQRGEHISLQGPPVTLDPYAAQPLGMVLHELATNAAKHGALSVPEGRLEVRWSLGDKDDGLRIVWKEHGGPAVTAPENKGFGSDLIYASVTSQLGGTVECDWQPGGLQATLTLPITYARAGHPRLPEEPGDTLKAGCPDLPAGLRVLVVEDNALVAMQMVEALTKLGCITVGPAATLDGAAALAASEALDAAILDVDLQGQAVLPAAGILAERNVPFIFATGFSEVGGAAAQWPEAPLLRKPVDEKLLAATLARAVASKTRAASA